MHLGAAPSGRLPVTIEGLDTRMSWFWLATVIAALRVIAVPAAATVLVWLADRKDRPAAIRAVAPCLIVAAAAGLRSRRLTAAIARCGRAAVGCAQIARPGFGAARQPSK